MPFKTWLYKSIIIQMILIVTIISELQVIWLIGRNNMHYQYICQMILQLSLKLLIYRSDLQGAMHSSSHCSSVLWVKDKKSYYVISTWRKPNFLGRDLTMLQSLHAIVHLPGHKYVSSNWAMTGYDLPWKYYNLTDWVKFISFTKYYMDQNVHDKVYPCK